MVREIISLGLSNLRHCGDAALFRHVDFGKHEIPRSNATSIAASRLIVRRSRREGGQRTSSFAEEQRLQLIEPTGGSPSIPLPS